MGIDYLFGLRLTSKLAFSVFTGSAIYVNLVEHPARMQLPTRTALAEFKPSFKLGKGLQGSLALIGSGTAIASYFLKADKHWLYAGLLLLSVWPFTLIFIRPVYTKLHDESLDPDSETAKNLLIKWNSLHRVRSVISFFATFILFYYTN